VRSFDDRVVRKYVRRTMSGPPIQSQSVLRGGK